MGAEGVIAAVGQAFFVLGIGMATVMILGSLRREKDANITKDSFVIIVSLSVIAMLVGLMIFPLVFAYGIEPGSGPGLAFLTLPNVFNAMPGVLGVIVGTLFYISFYIAVLSTTLAIIETMANFFKEQFNWSRLKSMIITYALALAIGIPCVLSMSLFNFIDYAITYCLIVSAFLVSIFVGWFWKTEKFAVAANIQNRILIKCFDIILKFGAPIVMVVIFGNLLLSQLG